ncbi:MAG: DUF1614 domain-containing protein [Candidatus Thermoplasmatota archaeon]|nr:DUF1614 domain-containing protein [Candidatus Thermoplasmatota archaeon]
MSFPVDLVQIGLYLLYILLPILAFYIIYMTLTKAFEDMGFTTVEAVIIVFVSFLFGFEIILFGVNISTLSLFSYENWIIGISMGGAVIPILLSIYLIIRKNLASKHLLIGIVTVTIITFLVTRPVAGKGIVSAFPYWLLPAVCASLISVILSWKTFSKAAPLAYISGTIGVLIGADFLHLPQLLQIRTTSTTMAVVGGANVFDMVYITGILAVILDGILMYHQRSKEAKP